MPESLMNNLKFAQFLADKGLLSPIVSSYKEWREQQNYPFSLKDRRLFKVAILKALIQVPNIIDSHKNMQEQISFADYMGKIADAMVDNLYGEKKEPANKEMQELAIKYNISPDYLHKVEEIKKTLSQEAFITWLESAGKGFEERKAAESESSEKVNEIQDAKLTQQMKEQVEIGEEIGVIPTTENLKKIVKKRVIRKRSKNK